MARITVQSIVTKPEWERFLAGRNEANFLQSWYFGEFYKNLGRKVERTGFYEDGALRGVMLSVVEKAKRGTYLAVAGGPVIDWPDGDLCDAFVDTVRKLAHKNSCVFVRVRPQLISDDISQALFKKYGFRDAPMHLAAELTSQIDLSQPESAILANMRKTTRYELRRAEKLGLTVRSSRNPDDIRAFYDLQLETAKRQNFIPFSFAFLYEQFKVFAERNMATLYSAYHGRKLLASAFIIFYGHEAVYHYGASTEEGRKLPGAYLLQWEAIREAKRRGMNRYNFWGVTNPQDSGHRFFGVSVFKRGFGGRDVSYLHAQDLVINKPRYMLNLVVESIRKHNRHL